MKWLKRKLFGRFDPDWHDILLWCLIVCVFALAAALFWAMYLLEEARKMICTHYGP